ncbi:MAG: hypothetical protein ACK5TA_00705, partial [bacterium]
MNERAATPCLFAGKNNYYSAAAAALQRFRPDKAKSLGCRLVRVEPPKVNDKLPCESHSNPFSVRASLLAELPGDFFQAYPFGLELDETPHGLNQKLPQSWVAMFVDGALPAF